MILRLLSDQLHYRKNPRVEYYTQIIFAVDKNDSLATM